MIIVKPIPNSKLWKLCKETSFSPWGRRTLPGFFQSRWSGDVIAVILVCLHHGCDPGHVIGDRVSGNGSDTERVPGD